MLFNEVAVLDRFSAAAQAGFHSVEFLFPYGLAAKDTKQRLDDNGLQLVLQNMPAGDSDAGERGMACHPKRVAQFRRGLAQTIEYAQVLGVQQINCLAGIAPLGFDAQEL